MALIIWLLDGGRVCLEGGGVCLEDMETIPIQNSLSIQFLLFQLF